LHSGPQQATYISVPLSPSSIIRISSEPNACNRVWDYFTFTVPVQELCTYSASKAL